MKNYGFLLLLAFGLTFLIGCNDEEAMAPNETELKVDAFNEVSVNGEVKVLFNNQSANLKSAKSTQANDYRVNVSSPSGLGTHVKVSSQGGLLTITADGEIDLSDSVEVEIWSAELDEIRLEKDQVAVFAGSFHQEELTVVTEARSHLTLLGVEVDRLYCKTEGESEFVVTTSEKVYDGNQSYTSTRGILIDEFTLLVDGSYVLVGDSVKLENGIWVVYGQEILETFEMAYCEFKTEGETMIDAHDAVARQVNINLEGQSEAMVWATESITGKGEGSSKLYYRVSEGVDLMGFTTSGSAEILPYEVHFIPNL